MSDFTALPLRLQRLISPSPTCWTWRGATANAGYPVATLNNRQTSAHRVVYRLLVGEIEDGLDLDHLCRDRLCVNPEHMEPVTHRENIRRGTGPFAERARQTHCIHGHEFTPENTRIRPNGTRKCRECERRLTRETQERRRLRKKALA